MDLKEPRQKKHNRLVVSQPLPVVLNSDSSIYKFKAHFDGFSVRVCAKDEMIKLNTMGSFGKGSFSRGYPTFGPLEGHTQFLRKRVFQQRKDWKAKFGLNTKQVKVIVVPDSDDDCDNYFNNLTVEYQLDANAVQEHLCLSLEEAFFLVSCVECLNVYQDNVLQTADQLWDIFCNCDSYFTQNFVVYQYFRAKNWVVKPGIKFGGDFLLYKDGPPFYHASYLVLVDVLDSETLQRREDLCRRSMAMLNVCGLNRLCETVGKELLVCQLLWPSNQTILQPKDISKLTVNEVLIKRWISSQNRESEDS